MNKLIVLIGTSCSGKTTWAKQYMKDNKKTYYVSRDQERESVFGEYRMGSKKEEALITQIVKQKTESFLNVGDVILDNTHLRKEYLPTSKDYPNVNIEYKVFELLDKTELVLRNQKRFFKTDKLIPEFVLHKQMKDFEALEVPENVVLTSNKKTDYRITQESYNSTVEHLDLPQCCIFDLDGTISLMNNRSPYDGKDCVTDKVNNSVVGVLDSLTEAGNKIIIFSGRNSDNGGREATEKWLKDNAIDYDLLVMRKEDDQRSDVIIKTEMFNKHIKGKYRVLTVFDDRDCVVDMWREKGLDCFQVYYGNF